MMTKTLRPLLLAAVLSLCAATFAAPPFRTIFAPDPAAQNVFRDFSLYCGAGFKAAPDRAVVDGKTALRVTLTEAPEHPKNAQQVQFRLTLPTGALEAGTEYRIRFRCRSDRPARMTFRCQESATPWTEVTEHAAGGVALSPEWKYVEYCLTPYEDGNGKPVWFPNFELGFLGQGNAVYFADLVVEALD